MGEVTTKNFGLLIAYILPGFVVLWALQRFSPALELWMGTGPSEPPTVGGFLYVTLASVAAGLLVSTVRWLVLDAIHHRTGVPAPHWDFGALQRNLGAFDLINEQHYRYCQAYGNGLVALIFMYVLQRGSGSVAGPVGGADLAFLLAGILLFVGSRDALRKYYRRVDALLSNGGQQAKNCQVV